MSVTTDGVKGYEYQYKITVLIALVTHADKINLFVEKEGSEDALLIVEKSGVTSNIEIQVKREKNLINIPKIVNWLTHFQERKSDNNLLQKLIDSKQNIALFVTPSRCSDAVLNLKTDYLSFEKHNSLSLSKTFLNEFKDALKSKKFGSTDLMNDREKFCKNQAKIFKTVADLNKVLEQCLIFEEFTDEKVDRYVNSLLNETFSIAQSRTDIVYLQLLEIVKHGRDTGEEVSTNIFNQIQSNKIGLPIIDSYYKTRSEEPHLIEILNKEGVLLLTGISQCGKTELAKAIATHFVNKGYDYQIHDDISELKRFLNSNIADNKIAILEDPFGHIKIEENYFDTLHRFKDLIGNKEKHHFLIVSSREELLSEIFDSTEISDYKIKQYNWQELTIKNNKDIKSFWKLIAKDKSLPEELVSVVSKGILATTSKNLLQIGQLMYLANEELEQLTNKNFNELEHIARRNSIEIAKYLKQKNENASKILSIISLCTTPIHYLDFKDLAYITSDISSLPSIRNNHGFTTHLGKNNTPEFPQYPENLQLTDEVIEGIDYLEERGLVAINEDTILITHPNYYEAGRYLFFTNSSKTQHSKLEYFKKCIGCLNPLTSFLSSKNYNFIHNKIKSELKHEIINIAFISLDSIFPSVEDSSLIFLTNFIEELEHKQYQKLIDNIQNGGTSTSHIYWNNSVPFISSEGNLSNYFDNLFNNDESTFNRVEDQISRGIKPNIYDVWKYLEGLNNKRQVSRKGIRLLLQFDEAFIRQKIVYKIFTHPDIIDNEIIFDLFDDEHPSVVFSAIRASLLNWFNLADENKELILKLTLDSFAKKHIAIRAFSLISTFSIDYSTESVFRLDFDETQKKEMWQVWGKLFPACVNNVPLGVHINPNRFGSTMDDAMKHLDVETGLQVLESWYKRIDYQIRNDNMLDEFEMAIADNLLMLTTTDFKARKNLFFKLVTYNDTSFLLSNLKWIVEYWDDLNDSEKEAIITLVNSDRIDVRWIKAVLLNSYSPPEEILNEIFGDKNFFKKDTEQILETFPENLLRDCLNVYCGFPQPLWWLAVHHKNDKFWLRIIKYILLNEDHVGFDICLEEFVNDGVNGFSSFREDGVDFWDKICSATKNKEILTTSLINNMVRCSCSILTTQNIWSSLIKSYENDSQIEKLVECIQGNIELILYSNKEDFFRTVDEQFLNTKLIPASGSIKLTNLEIEQIGKKRKKEVEMIFNYKLDDWIGIN